MKHIETIRLLMLIGNARLIGRLQNRTQILVKNDNNKCRRNETYQTEGG